MSNFLELDILGVVPSVLLTALIIYIGFIQSDNRNVNLMFCLISNSFVSNLILQKNLRTVIMIL